MKNQTEEKCDEPCAWCGDAGAESHGICAMHAAQLEGMQIERHTKKFEAVSSLVERFKTDKHYTIIW